MAEKEEKKPVESPETKGWLYKWTNYIKGYQKRWFVLQNGLLSYYRNQAEMAHTCRGTISLHGAIIHTENYSCNFVVSNGGGTQTFHLRASSEVERQKWVTALELAKAKAIQMMESDEEDEGDAEFAVEISKQELVNAIRGMAAKLENLQTCNDLIVKHGHALQRSVSELEAVTGATTTGAGEKKHGSNSDISLNLRMKNMNERATLFKITSNAMINACTEFMELTQTQGRKWQRLLSHEREQRLRLEEMVEQLARQHSQLEHQCKKTNTSNPMHPSSPLSNNRRAASGEAIPLPLPPDKAEVTDPLKSASSFSASDDEDDFHDAVTDPEYAEFSVSCPPPRHKRSGSSISGSSIKSEGGASSCAGGDEEEFSSDQEGPTLTIVKKKPPKKVSGDVTDASSTGSTALTPVKHRTSRTGCRQRRTRIPDKPDISFSLWSIMKNCIGKDLSKIPVPVNFSEPLSFLQRLAEDFAYSDILDKAAAAVDDYEQMAYVAAFTVSSYAATAIRAAKPFNPLLGETYELDRTEDLGYRCFAEQVMHHPPMVAQYCESDAGGWRCWQEFTMTSKFKGKYLEVEPLGITHLQFVSSGNHYTWRKVKTVVHNIVIGKLWVDNCGDMEVVNHRTNDKCYMKFEPYSYFGGTPKKVTGTITSKEGKVEWVLTGTWDSKMEGSKVIGEAVVKGKSSLEIGASKVLWKKQANDDGAEKYYNFSRFACELNEPEDCTAPTDSRLRPDQRLMEEGSWDEANSEKVRLEEKQRAARKIREQEAESASLEGREAQPYTPTWFKSVVDPLNGGKMIHEYQGGYWDAKDKQDWNMCPDIF